ncbi:pectinesterase family protein [uncultured Sunxiuqinia sp.]|uniref:pectinesterase family protein n=1 Tax=uncultured Sunxiuqinia sp. TaxID=1573825 RepID=UPI002AA693F0|nr:pectinesterase family protein [uncultured Sunxiuqinia sp.]
MISFKNILTAGLLLLSSVLMAASYETEITVAQDGSGDYTTIQDAIDACKAFPDERVTVFVKNGMYHEKVKIPACNTNLSLIGESAEKTIISYDDYFDTIDRGRNSTFYTYTLKVEADDFYAENLTIANTAGPVGQAVALHVVGDRSTFKNCRLLGHQDTLYTAGEKSRQYFTECYVEGTTDFIFGNSTVLFNACTIHSLADSYVTAASTVKGKAYGYVFRNCKLTAAEGVSKVYLGRPWRDYAKVVFMNCELGRHILPKGWANWSGTNRDQTAYYAEYKNVGPGFQPEKRIEWTHLLTDKEASEYTIENILSPVQTDEPAARAWMKAHR